MTLSIIIPAYNAAATIEQTVRNVLQAAAQVEGGADVWVVDDGSTDRTPEILDRMTESSSLHIIHQPNCGAYQARLTALRQMSSEYFGFVDADDRVDPTMFEKMIALAKREHLDVVQCGWSGGGLAALATKGKSCLKTRDEVFSEYVQSRLIDVKESSFIWDKVYRNQFDFSVFDETDHVTNFDDLIFNTQFFLSVQNMGFINEPFYHHIPTEKSAVRAFNTNKIRDLREAIRVRRALLPAYGVSPRGMANLMWFGRNCLNVIKMTLRAQGLSVFDKIRCIWRIIFSWRGL